MVSWQSYLVVINIIVGILLTALLAVYMIRYYWWKSPAGRIVVSGLISTLLVVVGGLDERWGNIYMHNIFVSLGYTGASIVLFLATRHVIQYKRTSVPPRKDK